MNLKKSFASILGVALGNVATIIAGVLVSFLIPKILPLSEYGWYKTFSLYTTYISYFHLGIIDGIVLEYGGVNYEDLGVKKFRAYFKWYSGLQFFFAIAVVCASLFISEPNCRFIVQMLGIDIVAVNVTSYYQQISQITQRFSEFSKRKVIQSICNIAVAALMFFKYTTGLGASYQEYTVLVVLVNVALAVWYVCTYKEISFGCSDSLRSTSPAIVRFIRIGFPLLFANMCSTIIITLDRQFVSVLFDTSIYAIYAFAYNMLSLVTVATSAVATVLYPMLKRTTAEKLKSNYARIVTGVLAFVFLALVAYFPLCWFVNLFLPRYNDSLLIFRVIFPGLALSSAITVVMHNYYKVMGDNILYFRKSVVILLLSAIANYLAYTWFKSPISISISSIVVMVVWYIYIERYFVKKYQCDNKKEILYIVIMFSAFYMITSIKGMILPAILYVGIFLAVSFLLFPEYAGDVYRTVLKKQK